MIRAGITLLHHHILLTKCQVRGVMLTAESVYVKIYLQQVIRLDYLDDEKSGTRCSASVLSGGLCKQVMGHWLRAK